MLVAVGTKPGMIRAPALVAGTGSNWPKQNAAKPSDSISRPFNPLVTGAIF